jgi:hypothetical protein
MKYQILTLLSDMADSADNIPSAKAIAKGLAAGHSADKPGYWIHLCGTGILQWASSPPINLPNLTRTFKPGATPTNAITE